MEDIGYFIVEVFGQIIYFLSTGDIKIIRRDKE